MVTKEKVIFRFDRNISYITINKLISFLKDCTKKNIEEVKLSFSKGNSAVLPSVATILGGLLCHYKEKRGFKFSFENTPQYLLKAKVFDPAKASRVVFKKNRFIFDKLFIFEEANEVCILSKRVLDFISNSFVCCPGTIEGLSWCMNEIMDNVLNHSRISKGYFMAQLHSATNRISISIYDTGIGLMKSINSSSNYHVESEEEAIRTVLKKGVTRDENLGQGNGIWGLNQIIKENKGYFAIMSGHSQINWDFRDGPSDGNVIKSIPTIDNYVYGTRIDFSMCFGNSFDIMHALDNYQTMSNFKYEIEDRMLNSNWINFKVVDECKKGVGTRSSGLAARNLLINILNNSSENLVIDFKDSDFISSSFADEFIAKLKQEYAQWFEEKRIIIVGCNDFNASMIEKACRERMVSKS